MIEMPIYELDPMHLIVIASLFTVILLALMFDRHLELKKDRDAIENIDKNIEID